MSRVAWAGLGVALVSLMAPLSWDGLIPLEAPRYLPRLATWGWVPIAIWLLWAIGHAASSGNISRRVAVVMVLAGLVLLVPVFGISLLVTAFHAEPEVVVKDAPTDGVPLYIIHESGFWGSSCLQSASATYADLFLRPIGEKTCTNYEGPVPPFVPRSARFERYAHQGLAALVADGNTDRDGDNRLYLELYQLSDGAVRLISVRPAQPDGRLGPVPELGSTERDHLIRQRITMESFGDDAR